MIKTTRIKYSQAPRIIVDDLSPQCDGVKQTFTLSRPVPEWAPYCLVFNGQLYTNTSYKQWFVLDADRKTIHTSFITPPTQGPNKSLILIVGVAGMEDLGVTWDDIVNKPEIPTEEVVDAKDAAVLSESKGYTDGKIGDLATVARTGDYDDLSNKPTIPAAQVNSDWNAASGKAQILNKPTLATVATSGSYNDLSNKPTIPAAQVNSDWNASSGKAQILNKPTLATVATSGSYNDLTNKPTIPSGQVQSDWTQTNTSEVDFIKNKPTLATVATSGSYNDLSNKPTIPAAQVNSDWNAASGISQILNKPNLATVATSGSYNDLSNKPTIPAAQVNSDWNAGSGVAQILNKPTIPTITMTNTDPGEGSTLAANTFIGVYQ